MPWAFVMIKELSVYEKTVIWRKREIANEKFKDNAEELAKMDLELFVKVIHDWNLYNEKDEKIAITVENLSILSEKDLLIITDHMNKQEKKS